jgi:Ca-activated chloride channel homolog
MHRENSINRRAVTTVILLLSGTLLAALAGTLLSGAPPARAADDSPAAGKLLLVLDSSGSMKQSAGGGTTKIAAARQALGRVVRALPDDAQVGMRVYGGTVFDGKGACTDSQNVVPVGPVDRAALKKQIAKYKPFGETPIGYALRGAAADLGASGKRSIVLVSDGEATCDPDPCEVAKQLAGHGVDLKIDVVGLRVNAAAEQQLRCIARAGNGDYADARDAAGLVRGLNRLSVRAFRSFVLSGTPIAGGTAPAEARLTSAGQYVDTIGADGARLYYRLPKVPGETVHVAVTARRTTDDHELADGITMNLNDDEGNRCASANAASFDPVGYVGLLTNAVSWAPDSPAANKNCIKADHIDLELERGLNGLGSGGSDDLPFELVINTEQAVSDIASLPSAVSDPEPFHRAVAVRGSPTPAVGGDGFNDAPRLTPGRAWTDTIRPGEVLVYKVRADWGQSPALTARLGPAPSSQPHVGDLLGPAVRLRIYSPDRAELINVSTGAPYANNNWNAIRAVRLAQQAVPVRYRNRESITSATAVTDRPGWYYFTLEMAQTDNPDARVQAPVTLAVDVSGEVTGAPTYVDPAPSLDPSAGTSTSPPAAGGGNTTAAPGRADGKNGGSASLAPVAIGVVAALVIAGAVTAVVVRGRRSSFLAK